MIRPAASLMKNPTSRERSTDFTPGPGSHVAHLRVLYLTTGCFDKGGVSRYSRYQIQALRELFGDSNVKAFSLLGPDDHGFEVPFEVDWHGRRHGALDKLRFLGRTTRRALEWRPDVIHAAHVHLAPPARLLARLCGAKALLNVYGLEIWSGLSPLRRWGMRSVDRIIADCHFTASYVAENGLHAKRPFVIWDCVDVERFFPDVCPDRVRQKYELYSRSDNFVILSLGRLSKGAAHKGYDRLIRVFSRLAARSEKVRLVIAGRGDDVPRLQQLARDLNVASKVRFTGPIDEADLADVYRSASVFSLVSDRGTGRGEGIPMTPLEAMACGVPIIVGDQDGSQEAVFSGENGFVVPSLNLDRHEACLQQMIDDPLLLNRMSKAAPRIASQYFDFSRFVRELDQVYQAIK